MILPNDFDQAKAYDGKMGFTPIPAGGHICRIIGARETKSRNGNDMIEVAFDIAEGSEFDGRFKDRFDSLRERNPQAKWPNGGMFRTALLTKDGRTSGFFKGFITSVEESNAGYSFKGSGANLDTMKGKMVGFNFQEEEYKGSDGTIKTAVKAAYAVSVATVLNGIEPPPKRPYVPSQAEIMVSEGFTEAPDEELPF